MTDRGYLGEVLEELRLERGMSLSRLAEVSGVSKGYLSALESGKQKNPSLEKLMALSEALGVSITVSRDEPGYIRVSEGSPEDWSRVRSGVPTVREEIEEAKEEASSAFTPDWVSAPGDTIADIMEERGLKPEHLAVLADLSLGYVNSLLKGEAEITREVAIGLEVALGPTEDFWLAREANYRKALRARSEWRGGEVKRERVEDPLAKAVELLDAIRGQVVEGDSAESFKMRLAQRVAQELVDLLRWRADRVDQRTENGRRARLHNNAMVSMLAFNDDFTAWREDVMVASGKRRDPDAGKKRSE